MIGIPHVLHGEASSLLVVQAPRALDHLNVLQLLERVGGDVVAGGDLVAAVLTHRVACSVARWLACARDGRTNFVVVDMSTRQEAA